MSTTTPNLGLIKPVDADNADLKIFVGQNMDTLDTKIQANTNQITTNANNIAANTSSISANNAQISTNTSNISANTNAIATKANIDSPTFTGTPLLTTSPTASDNSLKIASTAFVKGQGYLITAPVTSVATKTGAVTLVSSDVGLGNVTNESKSTMFTNPTFTGTPLSVNPLNTDNSTQIATTAFVKGQGYLTTAPVTSVAAKTGAVTLISSDVGLGNVTNESKPTMFTNPTFTGTPLSVTPTTADSSTMIATTAFVKAQGYLTSAPAAIVTSVAGKIGDVLLVSSDVGLGNVTNESKSTMFTNPTFTGVPLSVTPATADNTTKIATTAFVKAQGYLTTAPVTSVATKTGAVTLVSSDVGLGNVTNESKPTMFTSPTFTGTPVLPATTTFTQSTSISFDNNGNVLAPATAAANNSWSVADKNAIQTFKVYTDGTKKILTSNNTLDDGSGGIIGKTNINALTALQENGVAISTKYVGKDTSSGATITSVATIWTGTAVQYGNIGSKVATTLYVIVG